MGTNVLRKEKIKYENHFVERKYFFPCYFAEEMEGIKSIRIIIKKKIDVFVGEAFYVVIIIYRSNRCTAAIKRIRKNIKLIKIQYSYNTLHDVVRKYKFVFVVVRSKYEKTFCSKFKLIFSIISIASCVNIYIYIYLYNSNLRYTFIQYICILHKNYLSFSLFFYKKNSVFKYGNKAKRFPSSYCCYPFQLRMTIKIK